MPDADVFVAILSNRSYGTPSIQATAHRIAALAADRPIAEAPIVEAATADLNRITGTYRGSDVGTFTVTREGDSAFVQVGNLPKWPLLPTVR
jgi:hypothetical protein